jgi:hypothetical protein
MAARIEDHFMCAEHNGRVIATTRYSQHAAADGQGAWIVSDHPSRLFTRNQAITAMVLTERLAPITAAMTPFVIGRREELGCDGPARTGRRRALPHH